MLKDYCLYYFIKYSVITSAASNSMLSGFYLIIPTFADYGNKIAFEQTTGSCYC